MLEQVHFDEAKQSQLTAVELLVAMGYEYLSPEEVLALRDGDPSTFILQDIAAKKLMEINGYEVDDEEFKFSEKDVRGAIDELEHIQYEGLIDTAQKIFNIVMPTSGGKTIEVHQGGKKISKNFRFIDFEDPSNNAFHVTVEYEASGKQNIRPDIVCFVNGIPFAVIENKKSSVDVSEAVHQMNRNQGAEYCPQLFSYTQLLVATNGKKLLYGTTGTPNKFYSIWKEKDISQEHLNTQARTLIASKIDDEVYSRILSDLDGYTKDHVQKLDRMPTEQDRGIMALFEPSRLLDLTKNYMVFDAGTKKISRYQQYFAINKMLERVHQREKAESGVERRKGGLIWHTQGTGKSLTMVMFVKALIEDPHISNPRVIIVTDRRDLDKQIRDTFKSCNIKKDVTQAKSGRHLIQLIKNRSLDVVTTLVFKFDSGNRNTEGFVDEDENIFVLVDEAHRSQSGIANLEMNRVIPNACYIGFTGTPLMKSEKESWRKFGGYIDKYTIDDALADNMILPLVYEGRYVDLEQNEDQIDRQVERVSQDIIYGTGASQAQLKKAQQEITAREIKNNPQRIEEIARDIETHYIDVFRGSGLKGQVVAPSKFAAVLFQESFESRGRVRTAVVISDEHDDGDDLNDHKKKVIEYLNGVKDRHSSVASYEKNVIDSFKYSDEGIELIIVVDKLLTGFDAPRNTVLYLAKDLRDHNLLQAIARVNRLHENKKLPKTAGYIVDYSENAKNIDVAMKLFGNYDEEDVKGTLIDVSDKIDELEQAYARLNDVFKDVQGSDDDEAFLQALSEDPRRQLFYDALRMYVQRLNECYALHGVVQKLPRDITAYQQELKKFLELRKASTLLYAQDVDLSEYKHSLRRILDRYIDAKGVEILTQQVNITDREKFEEAIEQLDSVESRAEAIHAQMDRTIRERFHADPEFYARFSKKIKEIIEKMRNNKLADVEALEQLKLIEDIVVNKRDDELPEKIDKKEGAGIFYRNLRQYFSEDIAEDAYIEIVVEIFDIIEKGAIVDWYKNRDVKRRIMNKIDDYLYEKARDKQDVELSSDQMKKIIEKSVEFAENNHEIFS